MKRLTARVKTLRLAPGRSGGAAMLPWACGIAAGEGRWGECCLVEPSLLTAEVP